jgi:hypothetical protein
MDYLKQYDLETYIFETVRNRFEEQAFLNAYDFFCIIIWKANRAKTLIAKRLLNYSKFESLDDAVYALTSGISSKDKPEDRLRFLMKEWHFQLPMATAILTALYPIDFTVYDVRVCDELGKFHKLKNIINFENLWSGYLAYKHKVEKVTPKKLSLRDKDRYLWGKSFSEQLKSDIEQRFVKKG